MQATKYASKDTKALVRPRIMVAVPTNGRKDYCRVELAAYLKVLELSCDCEIVFSDDTVGSEGTSEFWLKEGYEVIRIKPQKGERYFDVNQFRAKARNALRERFLGGDFTHIFWLDADVIAPDDIVPGLLKHRVDCVSGVYYTSLKGIIRPLVFGWPPGYERSLVVGMNQYEPVPCRNYGIDELIPSRLMDVVTGPFGNTLMTRKIMEAVPFRWWPGCPGDESVVWFFDAVKLGWKVHVDSHFQSKHLWEEV